MYQKPQEGERRFPQQLPCCWEYPAASPTGCRQPAPPPALKPLCGNAREPVCPPLVLSSLWVKAGNQHSPNPDCTALGTINPAGNNRMRQRESFWTHRSLRQSLPSPRNQSPALLGCSNPTPSQLKRLQQPRAAVKSHLLDACPINTNNPKEKKKENCQNIVPSSLETPPCDLELKYEPASFPSWRPNRLLQPRRALEQILGKMMLKRCPACCIVFQAATLFTVNTHELTCTLIT